MSKREDIVEQIGQLELEQDNLARQIDACENEIVDLETEVDSLNAEYDRLEEEIDDLTEQLSDLDYSDEEDDDEEYSDPAWYEQKESLFDDFGEE